MKWLIPFLLISIFISSASAATLSDIKILEASKSIKYLTQNITKNYLYSYIYHDQKPMALTNMKKSIENLEKNIRTIALNTKKREIKGILDFLAYEKEQVKILLKQKPNITNANEILDFSELFTEGAEKISSSINYDFSFEDKMFLRSKNTEYLLEKLAVYYMVLESDIDKMTINTKLKLVIASIEKDLKQIRQYAYPGELEIKKKKIFKLWHANKHYYETTSSLKIPSLVILSTNGMQSILDQLAIHHAKGE